MSSRFVSAGAINPSTGEVTAVVPTAVDTAPNPQPPSTTTTTPPVPTTTTTAPTPTTKKQAEWAAIQSQLDAARLAATTKTSGAPEPPSLYETLQANKAAKQAAHDEATRLRNQFRALDEDEVEFLADVREAKRAEEERVRRETEEGLKAFREGRRVKGGEEEEEGWEGGWEVGGGGKRRRGKGEAGEGRKRRGVVGVLGRKGSAGGGEGKGGGDVKAGGEVKGGEEGGSGGKKEEGTTKPAVVVAESVKKPGGLVDYGSSDDDD